MGTSRHLHTHPNHRQGGTGLDRLAIPAQGTYWQGLSGFSLGFDTNSVNSQLTPTALPVLEAYLGEVEAIEGLVRHETKTLVAYRIPPTALPDALPLIKDAIGNLTASINEE